MPAASSQPGDFINTSETDAETARRCVACGYNLYGLGDEPRCPECGLLNIPSGYRQQVWDLVDSRRWFFSSFFGLFQKRPPGWWWALDRPGDVKRSCRFAGCCTIVAAIMILGFGCLADSLRVEVTTRCSYPDPNDPAGPMIDAGERVYVCGMGGSVREYHDDGGYAALYAPGLGLTCTTTSRPSFKPAFQFIPACGTFFVWVFSIWAGPAMVGLWTQIRKGLPDFARPPRTILAASNYESHRLLYLSIGFAIWTVVDAALRVTVFAGKSPVFLSMMWLLLVLTVTAVGAAGWIGPLRSDYTRQLVRSRLHAARIVVMYAVILPWVVTWTVVAAGWSLSSF